MHRELHDLYFDGDVVVVRLSLNGTHKGDLPMPIGTITATGMEISVPSCDVFTVEGEGQRVRATTPEPSCSAKSVCWQISKIR
jgi:hypothetical protein